MRKHGWQLPYHPLQVVAVAVFLALGFAFYVFFVPFIGRMVFQYLLIGLYTPLVTWVFCLYIWCTATDPGDPGVFKSKKYLKIVDGGEPVPPKESELGGESVSSISAANVATTIGAKPTNEEMAMDASPGVCGKSTDEIKKRRPYRKLPFYTSFFGWCPFAFIWNRPCSPEHSPEKQMSEDGMFYCTLCEVEVFKYSKHCRVCDKCVDGFDHHCRWLNNCIGRKNYRRFFTLMVSALLLLILQWSVGILVMICCFLERKRFSVEIVSKLGSSFSLVPFVVVVASCTILAMLATLPLAQLFFFHVLLIKKGISTYDYIVALREQEQQGPGGQQTPQMSPASSLTGLSSASSFNTFHRGAWCTPPRLFLEDQFDVVPPEVGMSVSSSGKRMMVDEPVRKRNAGAIKISPWTLARLNSEEVSKVAAEVRKKSRIMQPIVRREAAQPFGLEGDSSFGSSSGQMHQRPDDCRRAYKRGKVPTGLPLEPIAKFSAESADINSNGTYLAPETASLAPLQLEARSAFRTSRAMSSTGTVAASSPDSSLDSPDLHPFRVSEDTDGPTVLPLMGGSSSVHKAGIQLSRSTSDGYEASGGEDSDRVPSRCPKNRSSSNWSGLLFSYSNGDKAAQKSIVASSSSGPANIRRL